MKQQNKDDVVHVFILLLLKRLWRQMNIASSAGTGWCETHQLIEGFTVLQLVCVIINIVLTTVAMLIHCLRHIVDNINFLTC